MNPPPLLGLCLQVGVMLFIEDLAKWYIHRRPEQDFWQGAQYLQEREY
jgi:hypothetical protein